MVGPAGLEPATPALSTRCSNQLSYGPCKKDKWWSQTDSNRRHPACKAGALPTELWPRKVNSDKTVKEQIFLKNLLYVINRFYHRLVFNIHQFKGYK